MHGPNGRPINNLKPTRPNDTTRVRICLHVGKTRRTLRVLVSAVNPMASGIMLEQAGESDWMQIPRMEIGTVHIVLKVLNL
jgi:hypothetical protein